MWKYIGYRCSNPRHFHGCVYYTKTSEPQIMCQAHFEPRPIYFIQSCDIIFFFYMFSFCRSEPYRNRYQLQECAWDWSSIGTCVYIIVHRTFWKILDTFRNEKKRVVKEWTSCLFAGKVSDFETKIYLHTLIKNITKQRKIRYKVNNMLIKSLE